MSAGFEMVEVAGVLYRPEDAERLKLKSAPAAPVEAYQKESKSEPKKATAKSPAKKAAAKKAVSTKTAKPANKAAKPDGDKAASTPSGDDASKGDA